MSAAATVGVRPHRVPCSHYRGQTPPCPLQAGLKAKFRLEPSAAAPAHREIGPPVVSLLASGGVRPRRVFFRRWWGQTPLAVRDGASISRMAARIRIGTCSWADDSLVKYWYRPGMRSGEERLRYYAQHFDTVEANSTYYRLPEESIVANWAERVPDGFVMHVKAFGMMTRHPV